MISIPIRALLCILLLIGSVPMSSSRWTVIGPGGGGAQFLPTISPHDPRTVLVACDMTGSYITHDAGASWRMFNLRQPTRFFVFDPRDPKTMYAQAVGLWRSADSGRSWSLVHPDPATVTGISIAGDHGEVDLITQSGSGERMTALAIDPADSRVLYAAMDRQGAAYLAVSHDHGKTWQQDAQLPAGGLRVYVDPASPQNDRTLYVVGRNTIARR